MNTSFFGIISCYYALSSKKIDFHAIFQVHKPYLVFVVSLSQGKLATGGEKAWSKKKIGKKKTKRTKIGKYSTPIAHFWGGGELHAKKEGKERKEERINVKLV
jgi:hypothetical protein